MVGWPSNGIVAPIGRLAMGPDLAGSAMLERLGMRVRDPFGEGCHALDDDYAALVK